MYSRIIVLCLAYSLLTSAQQPIDLGAAKSFAVLGATTVTSTGPSALDGDIGVSPGTSITGFPPGTYTGTEYTANDPTAVKAQKDAHTAYNTAAGLAHDSKNDLSGQDLGGMTLTPAVYFFSSSAFITGILTLDAQGNPDAMFVFQTGSTLINAASNSKVVLINGAQACNVIWQVGSSATIEVYTTFVGNVLAQISITAKTSASVLGSLYALTGAVTLDTNTVTDCAPAVTTSTTTSAISTITTTATLPVVTITLQPSCTNQNMTFTQNITTTTSDLETITATVTLPAVTVTQPVPYTNITTFSQNVTITTSDFETITATVTLPQTQTVTVTVPSQYVQNNSTIYGTVTLPPTTIFLQARCTDNNITMSAQNSRASYADPMMVSSTSFTPSGLSMSTGNAINSPCTTSQSSTYLTARAGTSSSALLSRNAEQSELATITVTETQSMIITQTTNQDPCTCRAADTQATSYLEQTLTTDNNSTLSPTADISMITGATSVFPNTANSLLSATSSNLPTSTLAVSSSAVTPEIYTGMGARSIGSLALATICGVILLISFDLMLF